MSLRRLLGLPAAAATVSGGLRRFLTTSATHPPWAMITRCASVVKTPSAYVPLAEPPRVSNLFLPEHLLKISPRPDPDSDFVQLLSGGALASSGDGLLLLGHTEELFWAPILSKQGAERVRQRPSGMLDPGDDSGVTRFVFNPLTCQLFRLPRCASNPVADNLCGPFMGILTQADRGHGPPDRFAVAGLQGHQMLRFLSETEEWEMVAVSRCQLPRARPMELDQETLAFGGRLWWVDVTWGAISADPFSDQPELSFVELPSGSVLPTSWYDEALRRGNPLAEGGNMWWKQAPARYRRVGVSEGRLRYVELSREEPYVLSSFALDDEGCGWTLEHQAVLKQLSAEGGPTSMGPTRIVLMDPTNSSVVHLEVVIGEEIRQMVSVDMNRGEVIGNYAYEDTADCIACVLPPWLGSSRIPSAVKKGVEKNKTLADVLVLSDNH